MRIRYKICRKKQKEKKNNTKKIIGIKDTCLPSIMRLFKPIAVSSFPEAGFLMILQSVQHFGTSSSVISAFKDQVCLLFFIGK